MALVWAGFLADEHFASLNTTKRRVEECQYESETNLLNLLRGVVKKLNYVLQINADLICWM